MVTFICCFFLDYKNVSCIREANAETKLNINFDSSVLKLFATHDDISKSHFKNFTLDIMKNVIYPRSLYTQDL